MIFRGNAGFVYTGEDGQERVVRLPRPLHEGEPRRIDARFTEESISRAVRNVLVVGSPVYEHVFRLALLDRPDTFLELIATGANGLPVRYFRDLSESGPGIEVDVIHGEEAVSLARDRDLGPVGRFEALIRLRSPNPWGEYLGPTVLVFRYDAGGPLPPGTAFTRAGVGYRVSRTGELESVAANVLRVNWRDGEGVRSPHTRLEGARTNLVPWSDALSNWSVSGTPVVTDAQVTLGELSLALVEDNDGAAAEYPFIGATFTGDGTKAVAVHVKEGTSSAAGGSVILWWDATATTTRLRAVLTWSAGVPQVVMTTGTQLGSAELVRDGVYRLLFQAPGIVAANTNRVEVRPAVVAVETGNLYVGGVQAEDATFPSSYIKTTGTAQTRNIETLPFVLPARIVRPVAMTWYWKGLLGHDTSLGLSYFPRLFAVGGNTDAQKAFGVHIATNTALLSAKLHDGTAGSTRTLPLSASAGQMLEAAVSVEEDRSVTITASVDGGAETGGSSTFDVDLPDVWANGIVWINGSNSADQTGFTDTQVVLAALGKRSLATMRSFV